MGVWRVTYKPPLQLDGVLVDAGAVGAAPVQMPDGWPWAPVAGLQTAGNGKPMISSIRQDNVHISASAYTYALQ